MTEHLFRAGLARAADLVGRTISVWRPRIGPSAPPVLADLCPALADIGVALDRCGKELEHLLAAARAEGATAERARVSAIMNCPKAQGRALLAWRLAETGAVTSEEAEPIFEIDILTPGPSYGDQIARHPPEAPPVVAYDDQIARHLPVAAPKTEIAADIPYSRRRLDRGEFDAPGVRIVARGPYDDQIARHLPAAAPTRTALPMSLRSRSSRPLELVMLVTTSSGAGAGHINSVSYQG